MPRTQNKKLKWMVNHKNIFLYIILQKKKKNYPDNKESAKSKEKINKESSIV